MDLPSASWQYRGSRGVGVHGWRDWGDDAGSFLWDLVHGGPWRRATPGALCGMAERTVIIILFRLTLVSQYELVTRESSFKLV